MDKTYAVIMAGGVGSRFWPASKAKTPKQLLDLTGSGKTMIAATVARLAPHIPPERVIVVTGKITQKAVQDALPDVPKENILAEPMGRNTAPCIGWAALHVKKKCADGVMAVMPSDHLVADKAGFIEAAKAAVAAAENGSLVTFGIMPSGPETGFGYIETGDEVSSGVKQALRFVEKPNLEKAKAYVAAGNFVWNSGMFFFTAQKILDEIGAQMPDLKAGLDKIDAALQQGKEPDVLDDVFPTLPSESIDYGIMENAKGILCVPVDFGWSDLGSWAAAFDLSPKDENRNAVSADAVLVDARDCLVRAPKEKLVALVGVEDLIVVDTGDALLICKKDQDQHVKKVVETLKSQGRKNLL
ncbi:MAG: mannose-1-phosphate guanylyltransferase [Deltaproteobacteria bacterium]|nr:mannose-1-phosphate guanylyltransferase [Deltaproteobacteria bacterium]MBN2672893.1 mannose-1-phosphate guanylyltransferase [Deltaproteobacteria bacterium]